MKHLLRSIGLAMAFQATAAAAQPAHDHHPPSKAKAEKPVAQSSAMKEAQPVAAAFRDYRPFNGDEPRKDWRAANEEVRASGGHMGLMKEKEEAKK